MNSDMEPRHLESAVHILRTIHYLTIATVGEDGQPWNTPVSTSRKEDFSFEWGSHPESVHSKNIERDGYVFAVVFDSNAPEGKGEAVYLSGRATSVGEKNEHISLYRFVPERAWINDDAKNDDGSYKYDIRIPLDVEALRERLR